MRKAESGKNKNGAKFSGKQVKRAKKASDNFQRNKDTTEVVTESDPKTRAVFSNKCSRVSYSFINVSFFSLLRFFSLVIIVIRDHDRFG